MEFVGGGLLVAFVGVLVWRILSAKKKQNFNRLSGGSGRNIKRK